MRNEVRFVLSERQSEKYLCLTVGADLCVGPTIVAYRHIPGRLAGLPLQVFFVFPYTLQLKPYTIARSL